jgi:hypothetical protein
MLYKQPISYKKVLYYLFIVLAWLGVIIGVLDLIIAFNQKHFSFNTFSGFIWAGASFILVLIIKKKKIANK